MKAEKLTQSSFMKSNLFWTNLKMKIILLKMKYG